MSPVGGFRWRTSPSERRARARKPRGPCEQVNPLLKHNILQESRWEERKLVRCELCGVRVLAYDAGRHAARHEREANRVSTLRKQVSKLEEKVRRKRGRPTEERLGGVFRFRLTDGEREKLKQLSGGKSESQWLRDAIELLWVQKVSSQNQADEKETA